MGLFGEEAIFNMTDDIRSISLNVCKIKNHYGYWAKKEGINYYKLLALYVIYETGGCSQSHIMNLYGIPKQTINNIVNGLLADSIVSVEVDQTHKRKKIISFTEYGLDYAKNILKPLLNIEDTVAEQMGKEQVEKLAELFDLFERTVAEIMHGGKGNETKS